jgi:UPF0755 protein
MYIRKILLFIAIIITVGLAYLSYTIYESVFGPNTNFDSSTKDIYISKQDNIDSLIHKLSPNVKDISSFVQVAQKKNYSPKPGRFILKKGMNNNEIVNVLRSQNTPVDITFNNAENIPELSGKLASQFDADSLAFLKVFTDESFLNDKELTLQQSLSLYIPNTYEYYWNTSPESVQKRLVKEYEDFWNRSREQKRKTINLSRVEVAVLASIVQKESTKIEERPTIAGVYINRLKRNMKLQADPTVVYALKQKYNKPDTIVRRVLLKDLQIDSPFNTYKYEGLPPAPLIMPDVSSLDAVLNYKKHNYLYFVADTKNIGYHIFSKTLSEHNRNARVYREWVNRQNIYR